MIRFLLIIIVFVMYNNSLAHTPISNLVTPVSYFVNHVKQLQKLKNNLDKYKQVSVVGTSGFGKTQLARMYAYENKNNYNLIWFIDCNLDINKEFLKLAKQLNQINKVGISEDTALVKKEVITYLTHQDKWLLIFDNLKVNENKKIQDLVNWEHNGGVIFCSQDSEILPYTIEMTSFNQNDTIDLISNLLENNDQKSIEFLTEEFKGYPVLMVQGIQLLNKMKGLNREEYKKKMYKSADKIKLNISLAMQQLNPSALKLLRKISLMNNQSFSKQLLNVITDDTGTLNDDIYQLSKLVLISNSDPSEANPIFEMHDVIAQKIAEINGVDNNKQYIEDMIIKLVNHVPNDRVKGHVFRHTATLQENLEMIFRNAQFYGVDIYKIMLLNVTLLTDYINSFDYYNSEKILNWFNENDKAGRFQLLFMSNDEKRAYAEYLASIGAYYKRRCANDNMALQYLTRSKEIFDNIKGYEAIKCNVIYNIALTNALLGRCEEAEDNIAVIEQMFNDGVVDKSDIIYLHLSKTRLFFTQGKHHDAIVQVNKAIEIFIGNGVNSNDLLLTNSYLLKSSILNELGRYEEAYTQARQLYEMHKSVKREEHEVFGRIYTQMARSELGLGKIEKALEYVTKSIAIFLADEQRNPKEADYSEDTDLAASYVVQGDIFFVQDNLKQAIESYKKAQIIYFYLYRDRSKNVAHVSYLYMRGAKASCKAKDLYNYKTFGKSQVKEFGIDHPNTIAMFEYCKQYDMDLWAKEN